MPVLPRRMSGALVLVRLALPFGAGRVVLVVLVVRLTRWLLHEGGRPTV